jgi:Protein of unknown function (DUF2752)
VDVAPDPVGASAPELAVEKQEGGDVRVTARRGIPPLGAIFGGIGVVIAAAVSLLHLDRLPLTVCVFKGLTGLPCPTCGSTRAVARLFGLDLPGALSMNPFVTAVAVVIAAWALIDLLLLPSRRSLRVELSPRAGQLLRAAAFVLFFLNWVYLMLAGR